MATVVQPDTAVWVREIVTTVSDLHIRGLAQLDVKLNNFLVDEESSFKRTDFSSSIYIEGFKFKHLWNREMFAN